MSNESLTKSEKEYLEYFWNKKTKTVIKWVHVLYIASLEAGEIVPESSPKHQRASRMLQILFNKGYVRINSSSLEMWELTNQGYAYLVGKHSKLKERLITFIETVPAFIPIIGGIMSVVGFVWTVHEIVRYFQKS